MTRDARAFTAAIRARVFALLRAWSTGDDEAALEILDSGARRGRRETWTAERLSRARETFAAENGGLRLDPEGRNRRHTHTEPSDDGAAWRVEQMLVDTEGHNDWVAELEVDLAASRAAAEPVVPLAAPGEPDAVAARWWKLRVASRLEAPAEAEASARQGVRTAHMGYMQLTNNPVRRDASPLECSGTRHGLAGSRVVAGRPGRRARGAS